MGSIQDDFGSLIRSKGFRLTPQRQIILNALRELGKHATPEEVYERVQHKSSAINRATVYRTLDFLLKLGLVTTAHLHENKVVYEVAGTTPHHHLVCQQCQMVKVIEHEQIAPFFQRLEAETDFTILTDHLVLFGLCPHCRQQHIA
ncbi:MAG: transcriptional repressor [Caldilineaceae bacterium]